MPTESDRLYTATLFIVRLASRLPADDLARKGAVHWLEREGLLTDATRCVLSVEAPMPTEPEQRPTVRVRIAVAVDAFGNVATSRVCRGNDSDAVVTAQMILGNVPCLISFIEADVPLPHTETVEGKVVSGGD